MTILGLNKTTLLDYPEHLAATIFTGGCNLCCPFCHNRDLVFPTEGIDAGRITPYTEKEILDFLKKRKNILHGVCITGGEPTLQKDLSDFIKKIKEIGYLVKLDTNGFSPKVLEQLLKDDLLDYVAVDIKNSPQKYAVTTGLSTCDTSLINNTIQCLQNQEKTAFEFRTTIVKEFHSEEDMYIISEWIRNAPAYYLQSFVKSNHMISNRYHAHSTDTLIKFMEICKKTIPNTSLRGVDL